MQVSAPQVPGVRATAERLLGVWQWVVREGSHDVVALLEDLDLSLGQLKTLEAVAAEPVPPSVKDLSTSLGCSLANSSRGVDALVRRGLLERREDEHDRRIKRVSVTAAGHDAVKRVNDSRLVSLERLAATLTDDQRARLGAALDELPTTQEPRAR